MVKFVEIKEKVKNLEKMGGGWRSVVYRGDLDGKTLSFKVPLKDIHRHSILKEGKILQIVNREGVGGKLYMIGGDFIAYEYIDGKHLIDILNHENKEHLLKQLIQQAKILDRLKINKEEMHRPYKNVLVDKELKLHLIDFERAKPTLRPKNLSQVMQFVKRYNF
ncbi:MAG: serine/threonine protein kinase [Hydrogenothermaceae bacterium]|nr:serine/threonine protein kinase [Hydrogenothermaceae bacterium]